MAWIVENLWIIPSMPVLAASLSAFARRKHRRYAASVAIASMSLSLLLSVIAFAEVLRFGNRVDATKHVFNFRWFQIGNEWFSVGWVLDPLTAVMLVMVTFVGLLIFVYSVGYMAHDDNFARFFCFLSLFAGAMLGLVIANSLLLLFICWEIVGLTSYLLIGFWYQRPSAAAAAKKAFITTRIGDLASCSERSGCTPRRVPCCSTTTELDALSKTCSSSSLHRRQAWAWPLPRE